MKYLLLLLLPVVASAMDIKNESEVGVKVVGGNTETESYKAKTGTDFVADLNKFSLGGHYTYGTSKKVIDTRNWSGSLK